jgi:hypothetical protein
MSTEWMYQQRLLLSSNLHNELYVTNHFCGVLFGRELYQRHQQNNGSD